MKHTDIFSGVTHGVYSMVSDSLEIWAIDAVWQIIRTPLEGSVTEEGVLYIRVEVGLLCNLHTNANLLDK